MLSAIELKKIHIPLFIESNMAIKVIDRGLNSAQKNMEFDHSLLQNLKDEKDLIIHFYEFPSLAATYGHFLKPENYFCLDNIKKYDVDLAKRPTGGGIIFHFSDFTFSVLVPRGHEKFCQNTLESYCKINEAVVFSLKKVLNHEISLLKENCKNNSSPTFCLAQPTIYDVMIGNQKIGGSAQRRIKDGFLHQGSILISLPNQEILENLILDKKKFSDLSKYSFPLIEKEISFHEMNAIKAELKLSIVSYFNK